MKRSPRTDTQSSTSSQRYQYDVAFSFAKEQRDYVRTTYDVLVRKGLRVFYDEAVETDLWGADLYQKLTHVYRDEARYCVIFLSRDYEARRWTQHELKVAQARAFQESREYILPARFDDTEIPGLLPTIGYIDLRRYSPAAFADLLVDKIRNDDVCETSSSPIAVPGLEARLADAVLYAEAYLRPQPLALADAIAESVRSSFKELGVPVTRETILPYVRSDRAPYRVVGYFAFQAKPLKSMTLDLVVALSTERIEASQRRETRPLWQLLVCMTLLVSSAMSANSAYLLKEALADFLSFLQADPTLDPGGECKQRMRILIKKYA